MRKNITYTHVSVPFVNLYNRIPPNKKFTSALFKNYIIKNLNMPRPLNRRSVTKIIQTYLLILKNYGFIKQEAHKDRIYNVYKKEKEKQITRTFLENEYSVVVSSYNKKRNQTEFSNQSIEVLTDNIEKENIEKEINEIVQTQEMYLVNHNQLKYIQNKMIELYKENEALKNKISEMEKFINSVKQNRAQFRQLNLFEHMNIKDNVANINKSE